MRAGDYFVSSGEVLIRQLGIEGTGEKRTNTAEIEWTFPLEFVELVWGDGTAPTGRSSPRQTSRRSASRPLRSIPFDASGKKWVRLAVWDSAGNGAFTQPVHLK